MSEPKTEDAVVARKWWVDTTRAEKIRDRRPGGPAGMRFYEVAKDFQQEVARERLTDNNLKVLLEASPQLGQWKVVHFTEKHFARREMDRIRNMVALPPYARGVIVDSGRSVRLLVTGERIGERILELTLGETPAFDAWIGEEWVEEREFPGAKRALREFRRLIHDYLSPEAIAAYEARRPKA
ncbi:MAG: hypothetical protein KatS3mg077_0419 [Candidatus Binatia bacterium]|jgi:hypothetical protein|nr:MAG: hypothetical protein KatS3mg077_0419 [Candidatus Binatia bacterium]